MAMTSLRGFVIDFYFPKLGSTIKQYDVRHLCYQLMKLGRNRAISGKAIKMMVQTTNAIRKGNIPLKMVSKGTSSATPLMIYTLIPTGGVMTPISPTNTMITPNHMGLKPSSTITGYRIGTVRVIRARESIKQPPIK